MTDAPLLVANRGEIAVRIIRAATELGMATVAVAPEDDAGAPHTAAADRSVTLPGRGVGAYLDEEALVAAAVAAGAWAVHPGYGFVAERASMAARCAAAGLVWVGPSPSTLATLGDKVGARRLATTEGIPVVPGSDGAASLDDARRYLNSLAAGTAVVLKAAAGGGGRGIRVVDRDGDLDAAWREAVAEAESAFGDGTMLVEVLLAGVRHIEVQIAGDGTAVVAVGDRDCSVQRRRQKLIELAPAPGLDPGTRAALADAAVRLGRATAYRSLGTVEFLVGPDGDWWLLEVNPRLQVEHPVTEEVHGVDLVTAQLRLAGGASLADVGLVPGAVPAPRGQAVELRINAERIAPGGQVTPASGTITRWVPATGPGVRVDTAAGDGYRPHPGFDSLLAKLVVRTAEPGLDALAAKAVGALDRMTVDGLATNAALLRAVLTHPDFGAGRVTTTFVDQLLPHLDLPAETVAPGPAPAAPPGTVATPAPMGGTVVELPVGPGDPVHPTTVVAVVEAMKMQHPVPAGTAGTVHALAATVGQTVDTGTALAFITPGAGAEGNDLTVGDVDLDELRPDLAEVHDRQQRTRDAARPDAVERRRRVGHRTARENVADLCDAGSFAEYGSLAVAAQRSRRSMEDLIAATPADGLIAGMGRVNGELFGAASDDRTRCAVVSYDYTVLAGTQGLQGHRKKDRIFEIAERLRLPMILLAEGGGGRPGDVDAYGTTGLDTMAFALFGRRSGLAPTVGIVAGRCFAGNAALLGCCDVIIATADATIGMAGPAMIEGGGLGRPRADDIGPVEVQGPNGVIDIEVPDEAAACAAAKRYLSYFQGRLPSWECADQRRLRAAVPDNRLRPYDVRAVIDTVADTGTVLELRRRFGTGIVTALARIEGRPVGLLANNPLHLGGAIDADAADKAARFIQLCDAYDLPIVSLCDTPGFMVGPDAERSAQVRHFSRMFVTGASITVPWVTVVLRKGYGLGAQAMAQGSFHATDLTASWPTGEFGGMNLEGAVALGFKRELDAVEDPDGRAALYERLVGRLYESGKALSIATVFEIDDVIDPADTRSRILGVLRAAPPPAPRTGKKRPCIDTW